MAAKIDNNEIHTKAINTIRCLAVDATCHANSGHPGAPMGMAPVAHILFNQFMNFNPKNPKWPNRDRFLLSNGHGCMLQYALLHLYGYPKMTMEQIKNFRQLDSITPGHPEAYEIPGVEVTTGPLGQGVANAVGLAIAQKHSAATFNKPGFDLFDNYTYAFLGDGCLMEGISSEASSLAGHLQLGNLIAIYDDNRISIDGSTAMAFTEDVIERYKSYGWHTISVDNGDSDYSAIAKAIKEAKSVKDKPTFIKLTTTIGYGSLKAGTESVHGSPLKSDDAAQVKERFGFDPKKSFYIPEDVQQLYTERAQNGTKLEEEWNSLLEKYSSEYPEQAKDLKRRLAAELPEGWESSLPTYKPTDSPQASRKLSEAVLEAIHQKVPDLVCGSADLTPSNNTRWGKVTDFQPPSTGLGDWSGRYIRYGVREHAMAGIMNGLAAYGTIIPAGGTFLNFVSYAAGAVRLAALSRLRTIFIATHDSIGLGEDGPTHQPVETLAHFRALPNMMVWRPADGNETSGAYYKALSSNNTPCILALTRQNIPQLDGSSIEKAAKGGYTLVEAEDADVTLVATGSEVSLCVEAVKILEKQGKKARVVSLPCWFVFDAQPKEYQLSVIKPGIPTLSVEALATLGWQKYSHEQFGLDRFGASAPCKDLLTRFEFTPEGVAKRAVKTIEFHKDVKPLRSPVEKAFAQLE